MFAIYKASVYLHIISAMFWIGGMLLTALFYKLSLFVMVLILSVLHGFWLGPKAALLMSNQPNESQTVRYRYATRWIERLNLLLGLLVLYFAITLVRG